MNPVTIVSVFRKAEFVKSRYALWELYALSRNKAIKSILFISFVFFGVGILIHNNYPKSSFAILIMGGLFLLIDIFLLLEKNKQKKQYVKQTIKLSDTYKENDFFTKYEISDKSLKLSDNNNEINLTWKYFAGYTVYQCYLILVPKLGSYLDAIIFENTVAEYTLIEKVIFSNLKKIHTFK
jgi:hypothetical protein